jgi:hypothetical protein
MWDKIRMQKERSEGMREEKTESGIPQLKFIKKFYSIIIKECDGETSPTTHYYSHYKDPNQTCFHEANHNDPHLMIRLLHSDPWK